MDSTAASLQLLEELFTGPADESTESDQDRYDRKPQGTSDQGYRED